MPDRPHENPYQSFGYDNPDLTEEYDDGIPPRAPKVIGV